MSEELFYLSQMYQSEKRASDPYQPARTALAESCNRSFGDERAQLPGYRRLLFKIHRNSFAESHNSRRGYTPHQECFQGMESQKWSSQKMDHNFPLKPMLNLRSSFNLSM